MYAFKELNRSHLQDKVSTELNESVWQDMFCLSTVDLLTGMTISQVSHDSKIDWIEVRLLCLLNY